MLNQQELNRYSRHIILPEIGKAGQEKLKAAKVLVVGAGGLGCPILQYLTAAGVGNIGIIDFDVVDESNLQRQILFNVEDLGKPKAHTAAEKLKKQNPFVDFQIFEQRLDNTNSLDIIKDYDIVVDGCDNFATRYLVNDACVILKKPFVFGSIFKFEGQVSVFNLKDSTGQPGPTYRCLFPEPPGQDEAPNCATIGVLGVLPGIIGTWQANEALKIITGLGEPLSGKLLIMDALSMQFHTIKFKAIEKNLHIKQLQQHYDEVCNTDIEERSSDMKILTVQELHKKLEAGEDIFLLDVREDYESEICSIGGLLAPLDEITRFVGKIPKEKPVVVYCHHGMRSAWVINFLRHQHNFNNLYNLEGGIHQWALKIDDDMAVY
ncbi:MAG: molybdopterin-synthase adenylyltransferase MoeB [Bacteroidota bacterium]|nr:molybdopterin-synthase adenylyltransferase MoeB [Bacteroidota bacterium]